MNNLEEKPGYRMSRKMFDLLEPEDLEQDDSLAMAARRNLMEELMPATVSDSVIPMSFSFDADKFDKIYEARSLTTDEFVEDWERTMRDLEKDKFDEKKFVKEVAKGYKSGRFTKEISDMVSLKRSVVAEDLLAKLRGMERPGHNENIPKFWRFPVILDSYLPGDEPVELRSIGYTFDGSTIGRGLFSGFEPPESNTEGFPLYPDMMEELEDFLLDMMKSSSPSDDIIEVWKSSAMHMILRNLQELVYEVQLLSDRRFTLKPNKPSCAFKKYRKFSLLIAEGPMLKDSNQVVFRVLINSPEEPRFNKYSRSFWSYSEAGFTQWSDDQFTTGWMSLQMADLIHYDTVDSKCQVILSSMAMKAREAKLDWMVSPKLYRVHEFFMTMILIISEHKRNTVTCAQLARYLLHSATSLLSNHRKLAEEIFELPIRSVGQMIVVKRQAVWFSNALTDESDIAAYLTSQLTNDSTKDQFSTNSIYCPEFKVDFQILMDEIYYGNLFNVYHGFRSHRDKEVMTKIMAVEDVYRENVAKRTVTKDWSDIFYEKDRFCTFHPDFIRKAFEFYLDKDENKAVVERACLKMLTFGVNKLLKMTRSVVAVRDDFEPFLRMSSGSFNEKVTVLEAIFEQITSLSETKLAAINSAVDEFFAIFTTFNKPQHGKGREILIQSIMTRILTTLMNIFFEELCKAHPKDMTTKEVKKRELQSSIGLQYHNEATEANANSLDWAALSVSLNSDASKWAQALVMMTFSYMFDTENYKFPSGIKRFMIKMFCGYSNKFIYIPDTIKKKLDTWSWEMINEDETMKNVKRYSTATGLMLIRSGMGQGNLQHGSGFMHCIVDDYSDHLSTRIASKLGFTFRSTTLLSSDDSTKMSVLMFDKSRADSQSISAMVAIWADLYTSIRKLANIHINWKKTALQMIITEFNSVFTLLKRMYVASIKDAYSSVVIPDLSRAEEAVKEVLSNVRRLLDAGCYLPTIELALKLNRENLKKWYGIDDLTETTISGMLRCDPERLPFHLGFVPTTMVIETLLYGPEIHMAKASGMLLKFYQSIYTLQKMETLVEDLDTEANSKLTLELSGRPDKQLSEIKKVIIGSHKEELNNLADMISVSNIGSSVLLFDQMLYLRSYISMVKRTYGFSVSFRFNSLIRALQYKKSMSFTFDRETTMTIFEAITYILNKSIKNTFFSAFNPLFSVEEEHTHNKSLIKSMRVNRNIVRHPKMRSLIMYKREITDKSSEAEIIRSTFSSDMAVRARVLHFTSEISKMLNIDQDKLFEDPVTTLSKRFKQKPLLHFSNYVRWYTKLYQVKSFALVSDFPTTYNRRLDILSLYRFKTDPDFIYVPTEVTDTENIDALTDNSLLLAPFSEILKLDLTSITASNRKTQAFKAMTQSREIIQESMSTATFVGLTYNPASSRILYSASKTRQMWTDGVSMLSLESIEQDKFELKRYGEPSSIAISALVRNFGKLFLASRATEIMFVSSTAKRQMVINFYTKDSFDMADVLKLRMPITVLEVARSPARWKADLVMSTHRFNLYTGPTRFQPSEAAPGVEPKVLTDITHLTRSNCTLDEINQFMKSLPGYENSLFGVKKDLASEMASNFFSIMMSPGFSNPFAFLADIEYSSDEDDEPGVLGIERNMGDLLLPREIVEALTSPEKIMVFNHDVGSSDLLASVFTTVQRAVRDELTYNTRDLVKSSMSADKVFSFVMSMVKRDIKFGDGPEKTEVSDMLAMFITSAILRPSLLSMAKVRSAKVFLIDERELTRFSEGSVVSWSRTLELMELFTRLQV